MFDTDREVMRIFSLCRGRWILAGWPALHTNRHFDEVMKRVQSNFQLLACPFNIAITASRQISFEVKRKITSLTQAVDNLSIKLGYFK